MNKIILQRFLHGKITFGKMILEWIPNHPDLYTLELPSGNGGEGFCITQGLYNCIPHNSLKHPETWQLLNVPGRTEILIHSGNYAKDTEGCILVGKDIDEDNLMIGKSQEAMEYLRNTIGLTENFCIEVLD
jgi:Family of unknown function (DUF5675)